MRTLYAEKALVRRRSWEDGLIVCSPVFKDDSPELILPDGAKRVFVPTRDDLLCEDWERVDGTPFTADISPGGFFRAMLYLHAKGNPVRVLDWASSTYVYVQQAFEGKTLIHFEEEGAESDSVFIPTRWDYLTELWTVYRKESRDVSTFQKGRRNDRN